MGFENSVTRVEPVLSARPGSVGDSRPLEVARAVVTCVRGRSPSVRAGSAPLSVAGSKELEILVLRHELSCFGLRARTQPGVTGGSLVSFADSASRSPRVLFEIGRAHV